MNITYRNYLINEFHIAPEVLEAVDAADSLSSTIHALYAR